MAEAALATAERRDALPHAHSGGGPALRLSRPGAVSAAGGVRQGAVLRLRRPAERLRPGKSPGVAAAPPPPYYPQPRVGLFRGAFGGAAFGAIGGAIGGDGGKGAAIGAGVGGLFGMMRRHRFMEEEQQVQQQQVQQQQGYMSQEQNALARGRGNYNRAFSACMTARGYTVN
jgi:Glycine zipper